MNICIVTVYDSINSGSYWQARVLGSRLQELGHTVYYYRREKKGASSSRLHQGKRFAKLLLKLDFRELGTYRKQLREFLEAGRFFRVIGDEERKKLDIDVYILGSDTIWNLDSPYFSNNKRIFWGDIFPENRIISYAGSVANTKAAVFTETDAYARSVSRWRGVSVRDRYTRDVFARLTDREISLVCDPTLLFGKEEYLSVCEPKGGNYIFVYIFDPLGEKNTRELLSFARERGLKVICGTSHKVIAGADEYIVNSPLTFMSYMLGADYVVTDTFHGTIFSVNFNKKLVVIDRKKEKVNGFLAEVGLSPRLLQAPGTIAGTLEPEIDFTFADQTIRKMRNDSLRFLQENLKATEDGDR